MTSRTATILAVALPLGLCLAVSISIAVFLDLRYQRQCLQFIDKIRDLQQKVNQYYALENPHYVDNCVMDLELEESYKETYCSQRTHLLRYIEKWLPNDKVLPVPDEVSRLEAILFADPPFAGPLSIDRDLRIFPNSRQYTAGDIVARLNSPRRWVIIQHIMISILLKNTSIEGNPVRTLLPFDVRDVDGLYNLWDAIRNGLQLDRRLMGHICRFGFYRAKRTSPEYYERQPYYTLFENIFQPYFKSNSPETAAERRVDLNKVIDAAVAHGMKCLGFSGEVSYQWPEEQVGRAEVAPGMCIQDYTCGELGIKNRLVEPYVM